MSGNAVYVLYVGNIFHLKEWKAITLLRGAREARLFLKTAKCYVASAIVENQTIKLGDSLYLLV